MNILEKVVVSVATSPDGVGISLLRGLVTDFTDPVQAEKVVAAVYAYGTLQDGGGDGSEVALRRLVHMFAHIATAIGSDVSSDRMANQFVTVCRTLIYLSVIKSADLEKGTLTFRRDPDFETGGVVAFRTRLDALLNKIEFNGKVDTATPAFSTPKDSRTILLTLFPLPSPTVPACPPPR